jgi:hypothetical protein
MSLFIILSLLVLVCLCISLYYLYTLNVQNFDHNIVIICLTYLCGNSILNEIIEESKK